MVENSEYIILDNTRNVEREIGYKYEDPDECASSPTVYNIKVPMEIQTRTKLFKCTCHT